MPAAQFLSQPLLLRRLGRHIYSLSITDGSQKEGTFESPCTPAIAGVPHSFDLVCQCPRQLPRLHGEQASFQLIPQLSSGFKNQTPQCNTTSFIISEAFSCLYLNFWNSLVDSHLLFFLVICPMSFKKGFFFFLSSTNQYINFMVLIALYTYMLVLCNIFQCQHTVWININ